jgi:NAD(P)-dependent dehydrogenase (short-subunit alcohol dehydrogenase family)
VDPGKVVVTGAANGIGRATAVCLAARGHGVVGVDTDLAGLEKLAAEVPGARFVRGDVRDSAILDAAARLASERSRLTGWVNNAGIVRLGPLHSVTAEDVDAVLGVNLRAVVLGCQAALRAFLAGRIVGSIVNISSIHARAAFPGYALYDTAKGGVEALTRYVCVEYGHLGIRCNAVAPGAVDTAIVPGSAGPGRDRAADLDAAGRLSPMHRVSTPAEIGAIVAFLLSDAATSINGQVIAADNGMSARAVQLPPDPATAFT